LFIIDNLMAVLEENADSLYSDQANFVQKCKDFAIKQNCHVVLLAHPNKEKKEVKKGSEGNLEKTDISGSNNIPNKADNIIAIERVWDEEGDCDAIITCLKDRESGQRKAFKYLFSRETLRFYNDWTKENVVYGWEKYLK
jgi:twinkle protein